MADTVSTDETLEGISDEEDQDKEASSKYFVALWTPFCWKSKKKNNDYVFDSLLQECQHCRN